MKSTVWDYVWSGVLITCLLILSVLAVMAVHAGSQSLLGQYQVILDVVIFFVAFGILSGVLIRVLLKVRAIPPGAYTLTSGEFAHWKLLTVFYHLGRGALRPFVPFFLLPLVDVAMGAKIGKDVAFGGMIDDPYWVEIGNEVVLGHNSLVSGSYLWDGKVICGRVTIGDGATVGANSIVFPDVDIGAGANVMNASCVMPGTKIPAGETWRGNPARKWIQPAAGKSAATD
jgi:acetyltransferase-like isoleucine patch superfamily enzyme